MTAPHPEARRHARHSVGLSALIFRRGRQGARGYVRDLGSGGLRLETPEPPAFGEEVDVHIPTVRGRRFTTSLCGEVVWSSGRCCGLSFTEPLKETAPKVRRVLRQWLSADDHEQAMRVVDALVMAAGATAAGAGERRAAEAKRAPEVAGEVVERGAVRRGAVVGEAEVEGGPSAVRARRGAV